jgi:NTE family protein
MDSDSRTAPDGEAGGPYQKGLRLADLALFHGIDEAALAAIEAEFTRIGVPGGGTLFVQGDASTALYVIVYGRLAAIVEDGSGPRVIAHFGAGEVVGEMGLISHMPRSATLVALRDCELLRLDQSAFEHLVTRHPDALLYIARQLTTRLLATTRRAPISEAPRTVMLAPTAPGVLCRTLAEGLAEAMRALGESVLVLGVENAAGQETEWFHVVESTHDRVIYVGALDDAGWTQRCLRQCDRILLVARAGDPPPDVLPIRPALIRDLRRPVELVLVNATAANRPHGAGAWLERMEFDLHCHVRLGHLGDLRRLARLLLRRATGIALSGGGARGLAHIGVVRALREGGVPLDLFGGTSMGAIIGGLAALNYDHRQIVEMARVAFIEGQPFRDLTVPFVALLRGRRVSKMLRYAFGENRVEDTWCPFFCISTNLTARERKIHRTGPMWAAMRASISLPGLLPPFIDNNEVLVDGAMIDNFPSDIVSELQRGPVIGCDVSRETGLRSHADRLDERSLWWLLFRSRRQAPNIIKVLMASGTVSSKIQQQQCRLNADILLEPPLESVSMLDWDAYLRAIEIGYRHTAEMLEQPEKRRLLGLEDSRAVGLG